MRRSTLLIALLLAAMPAAASDDYDALFVVHGERAGVDWRLLRAIATVESHLNPRAVNRRDPSYGLMQVYCRAGADGVCRNRLDLPEWAGMTRDRLLDTETNIQIGAAILAANVQVYGLRRGVACYNAWRICRDRQAEPFTNQAYLEKVMRIYGKLSQGRAGGGRASNNTANAGRQPSSGSSSPVTASTSPR